LLVFPLFLPESQRSDEVAEGSQKAPIESTGQLESETALNILVPRRENIYRVYNGK
jgi:hypothetical protein